MQVNERRNNNLQLTSNNRNKLVSNNQTMVNLVNNGTKGNIVGNVGLSGNNKVNTSLTLTSNTNLIPNATNNVIVVEEEKKNNTQNTGLLGVLGLGGVTQGLFGTQNNRKENIYRSLETGKRHYFIGNIIQDREQVEGLVKLQNNLISKYRIKKFYKNWDNKFVSRYVYLGYLRPEVAQKFMEVSVKGLMESVINKFPVLTCNYTKLKFFYNKTKNESGGTKNWITIFYDDENNYLKDLIIPFLERYSVRELPEPIKVKMSYQPMIDLIHFKKFMGLTKGKNIDYPLPQQSFKINHISLISAKPVQSKVGYQSIHDQLSYDEEAKYTFNFKSPSNQS